MSHEFISRVEVTKAGLMDMEPETLESEVEYLRTPLLGMKIEALFLDSKQFFIDVPKGCYDSSCSVSFIGILFLGLLKCLNMSCFPSFMATRKWPWKRKDLKNKRRRNSGQLRDRVCVAFIA